MVESIDLKKFRTREAGLLGIGYRCGNLLTLWKVNLHIYISTQVTITDNEIETVNGFRKYQISCIML